MALSKNTVGAICMVLSMAGFTANDALVKAVTPLMNIGQIMLVRGVMTTALVFLIARHFGALRPLSALLQPMVLLRVGCEIAATIAYLTALGEMPLANAAAILQALPLAVTLGGALFLHEPVGWRRWSAITIGFLGVLIIIRPGPEGFTLAALYVLFSMLCSAGRDLATRRVRETVPTLMVTLATAAATTLTGAVLIAPMGGWAPMSLDSAGHLVLAAVLVLIGHQCIILGMRNGEISFIAPFRYTSILWAILLGFLVFGETPDNWMLVGVAIVVGSGLYTFYRETKRRTAAIGQESAVSPTL